MSPPHTAARQRDRAAGRRRALCGQRIAASENAKAEKYPELCNSQRVRLVVLASEVGGRWSEASLDLVRRLAAA